MRLDEDYNELINHIRISIAISKELRMKAQMVMTKSITTIQNAQAVLQDCNASARERAATRA